MFSRKFTRQFLLIVLAATLILTSCNVGAEPEPTLDVNAMSTAIVGTTIAELAAHSTQTALAAPTNTPEPTATIATSLPTLDLSGAATPTTNVSALPTFSFVNTPGAGASPPAGLTPVPVLPTTQATVALGDACNNSIFIADVTIPDGTVLQPGEDFVKIWRVQNTGSCLWDDGYRLVFIGGDRAIDPVNFIFRRSEDFVSGGETADLGVPLTAPLAEGQYQGTWRMQSDSGYYFGTLLSVYFEVKR